MTLGPSIIERLARARGDLRMGVPVVLVGARTAALVVAVEALIACAAGRFARAWRAGTGDHRAAGGDAEGAGL